MKFALLAALTIAQIALAHTAFAQIGGFVKIKGQAFERDGKPYRFIGANFWYGINLAFADRPRLVRELDRLKSLGVENLRIMASTEGPTTEPWRVLPALQNDVGVFDENLLKGLDFLLDELRSRKMVAVLCLNNFWPWSGGMAQYLRWTGAHPIPYPPPHPGGDWGVYQNYAEKFYSSPDAIAASHRLIRVLLSRTNSRSKIRYIDDPAIMAWQLANEPRSDSDAIGYKKWVSMTAALVKSFDANHLVSVGNEGLAPWKTENGREPDSDENIDYSTAHVWAQNWSWFDPEKPETFPAAVKKMRAYIQDQIVRAEKRGKPIVFEEFGLGRDGGSYDPSARTTHRDRYYREFFSEALKAAKHGLPVGGVSFWAWAGEAFPQRPFGGYWKPGQPLIGDPPHETQGWYSVYSRDFTTLHVISEFAQKFRDLQ